MGRGFQPCCCKKGIGSGSGPGRICNLCSGQVPAQLLVTVPELVANLGGCDECASFGGGYLLDWLGFPEFNDYCFDEGAGGEGCAWGVHFDEICGYNRAALALGGGGGSGFISFRLIPTVCGHPNGNIAWSETGVDFPIDCLFSGYPLTFEGSFVCTTTEPVTIDAV